MKVYPQELKASLIARMLPPNNVNIAELARETGIPKNTLYTWHSQARKGGPPTNERKNDTGLTSQEKFAIVLETASLNEVELSEYCRRKGLFPHQVATWRETCKQAHLPLDAKVDRQKLRAQANEIKRLDAELLRKDKALAEAAVLLVLQKKVRRLWEEPEAEKSSARSARR
jgi:transposase-like protein